MQNWHENVMHEEEDGKKVYRGTGNPKRAHLSTIAPNGTAHTASSTITSVAMDFLGQG
jgi:hypothetical protein